MTFDEWVSRYVRKTGDVVNIPEHFQLAFDEQHGFFVFGFSEWKGKHWLEIRQTCVNSWMWVFNAVATTVVDNKLAGVLTYTKHNPSAYARLTGAKYIETLSDGYHVFIWEVQDVQF